MKPSYARESSLIISLVTRLLDIAMIIAAARFSYSLVFDTWSVPEKYKVIYGLTTFAVLSVFPQFNMYRTWRGISKTIELRYTFYAVTTLFSLMAVIAVFTKTSADYSRSWFLIWFCFSFLFIAIYRVSLRLTLNNIRAKGKNQKNIVIAGTPAQISRVNQMLLNNQWLGLNAAGYFCVDKNNQPDIETPRITNLLGYLSSHTVQEVWISLPLSEAKALETLLNELSISAVTVRYIPDIFGFDLINHSVSEVGGLPIVNISASPMQGWNSILKWIEDKVLATAILLLISPIMAFVAAGVKLSSPGPVFYKQERVSWNGKSFNMLKFRSMPINNEASGVTWGGAEGKETTRFGQFIRKTSLDELPQFLNVLKGDMSIIGPRPERTVFVDQFKHEIPRYMRKHMMKAGISGWAQINGWRGDTDLQKRVEFDLYYIENWSLWLDLKIIFLTVFKGFINKNAY